VQSLADAANIPIDELNQRLERNTGYGTTASPAANYKLLVDRALAMLKDGLPSR
jgi:hypothetical protein